MFRKVWSFRLTLVHFNMCTVCSSGDAQTKFYLLPRFLNHVSCYSFNDWYDPFLQVLDIPYLLSIHNVLNAPPQEKNQVERDLGFEVARVLVYPFQTRDQGMSHLKRQSQINWNVPKSPPPQQVHMTHHRREHRPSVSSSPTCGSRVNDERLRCLN